MSKRTVCVVPFYNEGRVLDTVLESLTEVFENVLCIDDGSSDASATIATNRNARVIRHCLNVGQGGALATAFQVVLSERQFQYLVTFDADGQHDPVDAQRMVHALASSDHDVIFGSRFLHQRSSQIPFFKRSLLRAMVWFNRLVTDVRLTDTHNGLRAIRVSALPHLQLQHFGMAHATELVSLVLQSHLRYSELSVDVKYTEYSKSKGQSMFNSINIVLDFLWR